MKITRLLPAFALFFVLACAKKKPNEIHLPAGKPVKIQHADGFKITAFDGYKIITVTEAFPEAQKDFLYALIEKNRKLPDSIKADATVHIPVKDIVVTSTTHIPSLEMLGVESTLKGFPNLDYISSSKTRALIKAGKVEELGQNETINTETTINLNPDVVVSFGVEGENKALESLKRAGIPVVYNGDWVERDPLGKAEWIKFFAAFYDKLNIADSIFSEIETQYLKTQELAASAKAKPTVISGALFKDVWYLPRGESWAGQLIADANAQYLYADSEGTGSLSLSLEEVLDKAQNADFWIAPNAFESYTDMKNSSDAYAQFEAFQEKQIYGFGSAKGETGGLLYYEVAPNRPDWVLKDLVKIFHPELLQEYEPHFFKPLND